jgi:hypothetical protein
MAEREYQRLTWSRRRPGIAVFTISRASLWLAKDHLLLIETNGYSESYKRFYFRDIQAMTVQRTNDRTIWSIVLAALGALLLVIGFAIQDTAALIVFAVLATFLCVVPLIIVLAMGPTCRCQIRTAVQTEDLPIGRVPRARRVLERLRPLITATQGQMTTEEIAARMQQLAAATAAPAQARPVAAMGASQVIDDPNAPPRIVS